MSSASKIALEVKWHVENVESWLQKRDDTLYSPQFLAETLANTRWKLSLSPNWQLGEKYVSLTLLRDAEDDGPKVIDLNYELSFLTSNGSPLKSKSCAKKFGLKSASQELNVKQAEILLEKKEDCIPGGVLTVCCKLWRSCTATSKGQCSNLRSVIGIKCIRARESISNFHFSSYASVNFSLSSMDISLVSLDVYISSHPSKGGLHEFVFRRKHVECKNLCWYSISLFASGPSSIHKFYEIFNFTNFLPSANPNYIEYDDTRSIYLHNSRLYLILEVMYHPAITSEYSESKLINYENLPCRVADLEDMKTRDSIPGQLILADFLASGVPCINKGHSGDEDECCDATGKKNLSLTPFKEDMTSLYNDRLFCDTKLQTDTETFPAHKCVLSARSPVFKKMFTTDMKEKAGEGVNVPDMSSDTVRRMLQFLYTDCTGDLDMQSAKDLYIVSDKYDIASLKQQCSSFLVDYLSPANVCEVLVLADMHQDKDLESTAQDYVLTNDEEVFYSDEWKLFMKNYSGLAAQVMYLKFTKTK